MLHFAFASEASGVLRERGTDAGNVLVLQKSEPFGGESYMEKQKRLGAMPY